MSGRRPELLVRDMLDSAERIVRMVEDMTGDEFAASDHAALQDAVSYRLVVIGEAAASLLAKSPEYCLAHPEVPWKSARAMRNFIIHDYMNINVERIWETAVVSIPELIALLKPLAGQPS